VNATLAWPRSASQSRRAPAPPRQHDYPSELQVVEYKGASPAPATAVLQLAMSCAALSTVVVAPTDFPTKFPSQFPIDFPSPGHGVVSGPPQ
jgi:hypothetical protein